jgi:AcrR family transcriptional regulator
VGRKLFSRQGFAGTSTRKIAAEAGCNLALINHYFGTKEGLLVAIVEEEMQNGAPDLLAALMSPGTAAEQLALFISRGVDHFAEEGEFLRIGHREIMQQGSQLLGKLIPPIERMIGEVGRRFSDARKGTPLASLDPRLTAFLLLGAMQFYFVVYPLSSKVLGVESDALKQEIKRQLTAVFLAGLAPKSAVPGRSSNVRRARKPPGA